MKNLFELKIADGYNAISAWIEKRFTKSGRETEEACIDWQALKTEIKHMPYKTAKRDLDLFSKAKAGNVKAGKELFLNLICNNYTGKMKGMYGIGTLLRLSVFCFLKRLNEKLICHNCYAENISVENACKLARATLVLCTFIFPAEMLPLVNVLVFRIESFGDLLNTTQARNYINFVLKNDHVNFAIWTKNPWILYNVLEDYYHGKKPKNLQVIYSSPKMNVCSSNMLKLYILKNGKSMIDKIFTVYTYDYALENNITINCGGAKCLECKTCYLKNKTVFINEMLKDDQPRYYKALKARKN